MSVLMTGCSDESAIDNGKDKDQVGNILKLQLSMTMPADMSRATSNPTGGENGDGWRLGRGNENNVYDVYLYKYSSELGINAPDDTPVVLLAECTGINFKPEETSANEKGEIEADVEFNVGSYEYNAAGNEQFIAAVNTDMLGTNLTLGELRNSLVANTFTPSATTKADYDRFTMANAGNSRYIGGKGSKANPFLVEIDVERTAARIDFAYSKLAQQQGRFRIGEDGKYIYKIINGNDEVMLSHVRATNVMQNAPFLIKRLAASQTDKPEYLGVEQDPAQKYVVEPTTWQKTVKAVKDNTLPLESWFGDSRFSNATANYANGWFRNQDKVHTGTGNAFTDGTNIDEVDNDWNYYVLDYTNENTMLAEQTMHDYTTGLVLKATYKPEHVYKTVNTEEQTLTEDTEYSVGTTFWRWHDIETNTDLFFSNKTAAEAYQSLHPHSVVFEYTDGQCYYYVWLRHENIENDPTTTPMEFGIVRNNIYRVCVEFTGIGMPDVPDDMETPETIRMFIYVRKWNLINHPKIEL